MRDKFSHHPASRLLHCILHCTVYILIAFLLLVDADESTAGTILHDGIEYLEDKTSKLTIEDVQGLPGAAFQINGRSTPNFAFKTSGFWFRFRIPDTLNHQETIVLAINYPHIDEAHLYIPSKNGEYLKKTNGRNFPFLGRELKVKELAFLIKPNEITADRYYYIHSRTTSSAQFPIEIMNFQEFFEKDHRENIAARLYIGAMLIMFFYNFIFFLTTREVVYGVYLCFIASSCLLVMAVGGLGFEYLWPNSITFNKMSIPFLIGVNITITVLFTGISLPQTRQYPRSNALLWFWAPVGVLISAGSFIFRYEIAIKVSVFSVLGGASCLIWILAYLSWKGYRPAVFFSLSFTALMGGTILFATKTIGLTEQHVLIDNGPLIGSAMQVALLTLALADQFREIKKQKEAIQTQMIAMQEQNIQTLDRKVEAKTRDIRSILDTISQGIFTLSGEPPRIDPEFSPKMRDLFPQRTLVGEDPIDLLFGHSDLSSDQITQIRSAVEFSIGQDAISFELNASSFPRLVTLLRKEEALFYEIDWSPIVSSSGIVEKILVAVRDVTALKSLEQLNQQRREELDMIQQIIAVPHHKFARFLQGIQGLLGQIHKLLNGTEDPNALQRFNAFLHTIKGNARTFGFTYIAKGAHNLEEYIRSSAGDLSQSPDLKSKLQELEAYVENLVRINEEKLGRSIRQRALQCSLVDLDRIMIILQDLGNTPLPEVVLQKVYHAQKELMALGYESLTSSLEDIIQASGEIAKQIGKIPPRILVEDHCGVYLTEECHDAMISVFTHLMTNAVDHGIELPKERKAKGKNTQGTVRIQVSQTAQDCIRIKVADDGRGLDLKGLHERAVAKGLLKSEDNDPLQIAFTIFSSGVSTARTVTMLSGRGVGLDAVRRLVQGMGGEISLEFNEAVTGETREASFAFHVDLPIHCFKTRTAQSFSSSQGVA